MRILIEIKVKDEKIQHHENFHEQTIQQPRYISDP